ncbi:MAG: hypothetical protein ACHQNE_05070, partial [Candidatus Kapaibacterium sp.]
MAEIHLFAAARCAPWLFRSAWRSASSLRFPSLLAIASRHVYRAIFGAILPCGIIRCRTCGLLFATILHRGAAISCISAI